MQEQQSAEYQFKDINQINFILKAIRRFMDRMSCYIASKIHKNVIRVAQFIKRDRERIKVRTKKKKSTHAHIN